MTPGSTKAGANTSGERLLDVLFLSPWCFRAKPQVGVACVMTWRELARCARPRGTPEHPPRQPGAYDRSDGTADGHRRARSDSRDARPGCAARLKVRCKQANDRRSSWCAPFLILRLRIHCFRPGRLQRLEQQHVQQHTERRARRGRPGHGVVAHGELLLVGHMHLFVGQLHRRVRLVALHHGLLGRQLRADLPPVGRLHPGLLGGPLPDLLRRRHMQRRLLVGSLQHVVPERRHVHGELLGGKLRARLRRRGALHGLELLGRRLYLHGPGLLQLTEPPPRRADTFAARTTRPPYCVADGICRPRLSDAPIQLSGAGTTRSLHGRHRLPVITGATW
jgi:hypothetical protein